MRRFLKKTLSIILVLALLLCFFMVPYTVHALGLELAASLGLGTAFGSAALVAGAILIGAGLGFATANLFRDTITSFINKLSPAERADLNTKAASVEAAIDAATDTDLAKVDITTGSLLSDAVGRFVNNTVTSENTLDFTKSTLVYQNQTGTFSTARAQKYLQAQNLEYMTYGLGSNTYPVSIFPEYSVKLGVTVSTADNWNYYYFARYLDVAGNIYYLDDPADPPNSGRIPKTNSLTTLMIGDYAGNGELKYNDLKYPYLTYYLQANYIYSGDSSAYNSHSFNIVSIDGLPFGYQTVDSKKVFNLYPLVLIPNFTYANPVPNAPVSVGFDSDYLPDGIVIADTPLVTTKPLKDDTVIAVPVPRYGIEEGVKFPTQTVDDWTDDVIDFTPEGIRADDPSVPVVPPIDIGDSTTWPTIPGTTIPIDDASDLPLDIATDLTLDPDAGNPNGDEVSWWFRIPILGAILRALARLWELLSQFFNSIRLWFSNLFNNLYNWLKPIFDRLGNIWTLLSQILAKLGQLVMDLPAFLADIFLLISGYTIFQTMLDGFLPEVVVSVIWVFWMAAIAIWLARWLADR